MVTQIFPRSFALVSASLSRALSFGTMMRFSTFLEWANKKSGYSVLLLRASSLALEEWGMGDVRHKGSQEPSALMGGATAFDFRSTWPEKKLQVPNTQLHEAVQILLAQQEGSHGFCDFPRPSRMTTLEKEIVFLYWSKTVE